MKIDKQFIQKIKDDRELHLAIGNLAVLAATVGDLQKNVKEIKTLMRMVTKDEKADTN